MYLIFGIKHQDLFQAKFKELLYCIVPRSFTMSMLIPTIEASLSGLLASLTLVLAAARFFLDNGEEEEKEFF